MADLAFAVPKISKDKVILFVVSTHLQDLKRDV